MDDGDRRVKRTQKILMEALVAVSLEKSYDQVKIKDITDHANVAYSTFFRHFRDKDELLIKMLESVVSTMTYLKNENIDTSGSAKGRVLFEHVLQNHRFYRVLLDSQNAAHVLQPLQRIIQRDIQTVYPYLSNNLIPLELISSHVAISALGMIKWWLDHDMLYSVEIMSCAFDQLIVKPLERMAVDLTA